MISSMICNQVYNPTFYLLKTDSELADVTCVNLLFSITFDKNNVHSVMKTKNIYVLNNFVRVAVKQLQG